MINGIKPFNHPPIGQAFGSGSGRSGDDFARIVMVMMVCITIGYVARLYFTHGAD